MTAPARHVFLDSLTLHGVEKIFGNPGTTETPLLDSLRDYPDIEYVVTLHEGVAVCAASFYAQATGRTAVANMHVAPGLGNAIGMIYGALKANSPLIVTAGAQDTRMRLRNPVLGYDLVSMAAPVTKWAVQVERGDEMAPIMRRAFQIANQHPKGPVFVALPIDVMEHRTEIAAVRADEVIVATPIAQSALDKAAALLRASDSPAIVVGDDVARAEAVDLVVALAERIGAAVYNELITAHAAFPQRHPSYRGRLGPDHAAMRHALGNHDLVLLIGGPFFEEIWHTPTSPFAPHTRVVQLEASERTLAFNFPVTLGLAGDLRDGIARLVEAVGNVAGSKARNEQLTVLRAEEERQANERLKSLWDRSPMTPARALHELVAALPTDVVLVDESITAGGDVMRNFATRGPHDSYGGRGGGIGQGVAGAIGVAVAHRDRRIVAVSGDGSAMYSVQSLWSAAHHGLKILFVILSNREYRVLKHNADQYRSRFDVASSNTPYPFMDLSKPTLDFPAMAVGMGVGGEVVTDPDAIRSAVERALAVDGPYLIDLVVEGLEYRGSA